MKKVILIFLFITQLFAGNRYVDGNIGSSGNGQSWATAWKAFSNITWSQLTPGDTLFISGGASSTAYSSQLTPAVNGTWANLIYILPGKYSSSPSGHSGRVIINNSGSRNIYIQNRNYLWIKGFELTNATSGFEIEDGAQYVICDSMNIYEFKGQAGVRMNTDSFGGIDSCVVQNCRIESPAIYNGQTDGMYFQKCTRLLIRDNWVHQRNQDPTAHTDAIQGNNNAGAVAYNNFCINDSVNSTEGGGTPMIFGFDGFGGGNPTYNIMVANNFLYMGGIWYAEGSQNSSWWSRSYDNVNQPCWLINNTVVVNGPRCRGMIFEYQTYASNNIIALYSTTSQMSNIEGGGSGSVAYVYVDSTRNNLYYRTGGSPDISAGSTQWVGHNGSPTGDPSWANWFTTWGGTGQAADPKLEINVGYEPDQGLLRPDLESDSPAIDAGNDEEDTEAYIEWIWTRGFSGNGANPHTLDVHGIDWRIPNDRDIYNNPRGAIPDIGAFEFPEGWTPPDTVPSFSITAVNNAEINTEYIASGTFSNADSTFHVWTTTGANFQINSGGYSTAMKTAVNGDTWYIKNVTGGSYSTAYTETLLAGGYSRDYVVTTKAEPPPSNETNLLHGSDGKLLYTSDGKIIRTMR